MKYAHYISSNVTLHHVRAPQRSYLSIKKLSSMKSGSYPGFFFRGGGGRKNTLKRFNKSFIFIFVMFLRVRQTFQGRGVLPPLPPLDVALNEMYCFCLDFNPVGYIRFRSK